MSDIHTNTGWLHVQPDGAGVALIHRSADGLRADRFVVDAPAALRLAIRLITASSAVLDPTHTRIKEV
jgi:hypothetical protein